MRPHLILDRYRAAIAQAVPREAALEVLDGPLPEGTSTLPGVDPTRPGCLVPLFWVCPYVTYNEWVEAWHEAAMRVENGYDFETYLASSRFKRLVQARKFLLGPIRHRRQHGISPRIVLQRLVMLGAQHSDYSIVVDAFESSLKARGRVYRAAQSFVTLPLSGSVVRTIDHTLDAPNTNGNDDLILPEVTVKASRAISALLQASDGIGDLLARYLVELPKGTDLDEFVRHALDAPHAGSFARFRARHCEEAAPRAEDGPRITVDQMEAVLSQETMDVNQRFEPHQKMNLTSLFRLLSLDHGLVSHSRFVDLFGKPFTSGAEPRWKTPHSAEQAAKFNSALEGILVKGGLIT